MFEDKMNSRRLAGARQRTEEGESLRLLSWEELRARLAAARDLRKVMGLRQNGPDASFAADAALHLKEFEESIPGVNPNALGNGKASRGRAKGTAQQDSSDDRGQDD
ncbi:MAG: hypothetical protein WCY92_07735 [Novosphingobium sp.]